MEMHRVFASVGCWCLLFAGSIGPWTVLCSGQSFLSELKSEHDPGKRSELALDFADEAFANAKVEYAKGAVHQGDALLDQMTAALQECASSLDSAHKAKYFKRAEMKVAYLQRRMQGLVDDLSAGERGWAEVTNRKLDEIHDKLLNGVMRK
jgi:rhodanese-related sulfurtransferase